MTPESHPTEHLLLPPDLTGWTDASLLDMGDPNHGMLINEIPREIPANFSQDDVTGDFFAGSTAELAADLAAEDEAASELNWSPIRAQLREVGPAPLFDLDAILARAQQPERSNSEASDAQVLSFSGRSASSSPVEPKVVSQVSNDPVVRPLTSAKSRRFPRVSLAAAASVVVAVALGATALNSRVPSNDLATASESAPDAIVDTETAAVSDANAQAKAPQAEPEAKTSPEAAAVETVPAEEQAPADTVVEAAAAETAAAVAPPAPPAAPPESAGESDVKRSAEPPATPASDASSSGLEQGVVSEDASAPKPAPNLSPDQPPGAPLPGPPVASGAPPAAPGNETTGDAKGDGKGDVKTDGKTEDLNKPGLGGATATDSATGDTQIPVLTGGPFTNIGIAVAQARVQAQESSRSATLLAAQQALRPVCALALNGQVKSTATPMYFRAEVAGQLLTFAVFLEDKESVVVAADERCSAVPTNTKS
jgi:hypothetical protein